MLNDVQGIDAVEIDRFAWDRLRLFHNEVHTIEKLQQRHMVPRNQTGNLKKQSSQIRYCLKQAQEYFDAHKSVSLATSPVLLYYSIMQLAIVEILFKQSGDSSLDKAREKNRHHGLEFTTSQKIGPSLQEAVLALRARPSIFSGIRKGTFELWHKTARLPPIAGKTVVTKGMSSTTGTRLILQEDDCRMSLIPEGGISFDEIIKNVPGLYQFIIDFGLIPTLARGKIECVTTDRGDSEKTTLTTIIHPTAEPVLRDLEELIKVPPSEIPNVECEKLSLGFLFRASYRTGDLRRPIHYPSGFSITEDLTMFLSKTPPLNEFGYYHVGLFTCGSLARYYPDIWVKSIESSNYLSISVQKFLECAAIRAPLLCLSELNEIYYVQK